MNATLAKLISRFRAAQDRAVTSLERLGIQRPTSRIAWTVIRIDEFHSREVVKLRKHAVGIEVTFEDLNVDFDWGDAGEADGFDAWRLFWFSECNKLGIHISDQSEVDDWLKRAYLAGELTKDSYLYYSPAHRSPARVVTPPTPSGPSV